MEEQDNPKPQYAQWAIMLLIVVIVIVTFYAISKAMTITAKDFEITGEIGDTIGGITAPFIGLLGAILVYVSFQAQLSANQMQFRALRKERKRWKKDRDKYEADRWFQQSSNQLQEIKLNIKDLKLIIPMGIDIKEYYHDEIISLNGTSAVMAAIRMLREYSIITQPQRDAIDAYIFDFTYIIDEFEELVENDNDMSNFYPEGFKKVKKAYTTLYTYSIRHYIEQFSNILDENNDPENRRNQLIKSAESFKTLFPREIVV